MSTFDGFLREYPLVSVDRFEDANLSSTTFFLSHCHTDHTVGLNNDSFKYEIIKRSFSKIYMSNVSKLLLKTNTKYKDIYDYFQVLPIESPTIISILNESGKEITKLTVTLLPAGHCPGSVMFLFEGDNGNVLYTGDFRLEAGSCERLKHLHSTNGTIKPLRKLYVDTTFCDPLSLFIPSREECFDAILQKIKPWIGKGPNHVIFLLCSAKYGYEYAFIGLHKKFGMKIHVEKEKLRDYAGVPEILEAVTSDANATQIHSCIWKYKPKPYYDSVVTNCGYCAPNRKKVYVRCIKLSAMFFTSSLYVNDICINIKEEFFKSCFSTHSSLYEIMDMVSYLQPKTLYANVVPGEKTQKSVLQHLWPLLKKKYNGNKETNFTLGTLLQSVENEEDSVTESYGSLNFDCDITINEKSSVKPKDTVVGNDKNHEDLDGSDVTNSQNTNQGSSSGELAFTSDDEKDVSSMCEIDKNSGDFKSNELQSMEENNEDVNRSIEKDFPKWNYSSSDDGNDEDVETKTDDKSAAEMSHDNLHKKCDTSVIDDSKSVIIENSQKFDSMSSWSYSSSCGGYKIRNSQSGDEPEREKRSCCGLARNKNVDATKDMTCSDKFPEWQFASYSHGNDIGIMKTSESNKNKTSRIVSTEKLPCTKFNNAVKNSKGADNTVENVFSPKWSYLPSDDDDDDDNDEMRSKYVSDDVKIMTEKISCSRKRESSSHCSDNIGRYHFPSKHTCDTDLSKRDTSNDINKLSCNIAKSSALPALSSTSEARKNLLYVMNSQTCDIAEGRKRVEIESNSLSNSRVLEKVSSDSTASPGGTSDEESLDESPSVLSSLNEAYVRSLTEHSHIMQECLLSDDAIAANGDGNGHKSSLTKKDDNNFIFSATETKRVRLCDGGRLNSNDAVHYYKSFVDSTSSSCDDIRDVNLD